MLVVKIEVERNKENYKAVMEALADFDVEYAAWENPSPDTKIDAKSARTGDDLSSAISAAVNAFGRSRDRRL